MKKAITLAVGVIVAALAVSFTGCTMHITMNPSSVSDMEYGRIPGRIILFMDSEFRNYHWQGFSDAELKGLDYDLGSASRNHFYDAFRRASDQVTVVEKLPAFPVAAQDGMVLVVQPRIGGFSEKHNLFIRNADYDATITYHVIVYDKAGRIILEKDYTATGSETGGMDVYRNYAAPAEIAMARTVKTILADISKLASMQKAP
ncbi:MAG TPA: hypothetical protein VKO67_00110 [Smithellaceae bacterium]|nr:hypothetical protein [Smithellaceae bacterium]